MKNYEIPIYLPSRLYKASVSANTLAMVSRSQSGHLSIPGQRENINHRPEISPPRSCREYFLTKIYRDIKVSFSFDKLTNTGRRNTATSGSFRLTNQIMSGDDDTLVNINSNKRVLFWSIMGVFSLLLISLGYGYMVCDLFKSPYQIYLEAERHSLAAIFASLTSTHDQSNNKHQTQREGTINSHRQVTINIAGSLFADKDSKALSHILQQSKLTLDSSLDRQNQLYYQKANLLLDNKNILTMELLTDKNRLYLHVPEIYPRHLLADLQEAEKLQKNLALKTLPKRLISQDQLISTLRLSTAQKPVLAEYANTYFQQINKQQVTMQKALFTECDISIPARKITVTFSEKQLKELIKTVAEKMFHDEQFIDLVYDKQQKFFSLLVDSGWNLQALKVTDIDKADIKKALQEEYNQLIDSLDDAAIANGLTMTLWIDNNDQILERQINLGSPGDRLSFRSARWTEKNKTDHQLIAVRGRAGSDKLEFQYSATQKKTSRECHLDLQYQYSLPGRGEGKINLQMTGNDLYGGLIKPPTPAQNQIIDLAKLNQHQLQELKQDIQNGISGLLLINALIFEAYQESLTHRPLLSNATAGAASTETIITRPGQPALNQQTVIQAMRHTVLANDPASFFIPPPGNPLEIIYTPDGQGGWLAAAIGALAPGGFPSADGKGHLVFFFHNNKFVGWDAAAMSTSIKNLTTTGNGIFKVTYAHYAPDDPLCCPSLPDREILYCWNSQSKSFTASALPPDVEDGTGNRVVYLAMY